jgi:hypothetical protein
MVAIRAITDAPRRKSERLIECVVGEVFVFINKPFRFPARLNLFGCKSRAAVGHISRNIFCQYAEMRTKMVCGYYCPAAATQNCRPLRFVLEIQPQFQPVFLRVLAMISQYFTRLDSAVFALHTETVFLASGRRFRLKMNCHGLPKARDNKYLFDHRLDRFNYRLDHFDHRLSEICSALGCINTLADWSTFKSDTGRIPDAHSHRNARTEGNTPNYPGVDAVTKSSPHASASPTQTPPPIASLIG